MASNSSVSKKIIAVNRKARRDYKIEDTLEAGIILTGTEVKSLRLGRINIGDSYAAEKSGEIFLQNAHISEYFAGNIENHEPNRPRKLLLRSREIAKLIGTLRRGGITLVPLSLYFNPRGIAKVELAVASGKRKYDKRQTEKARSWQRQKERLIRKDV
jgi:SsrA-binding protein|tara:strand:+ start:231 stop:704 length:474 start_codon:yes stop_codon:yes gene_type:complete